MPRARSNRLTELGELQLQVLDLLTRRGAATVYDILDDFAKQQRPRYTTVLTVLRALEEKGLAEHEERGRSYVFRPTAQAGAVRGALLRDVLHKVFNNSPRDLVATLLDSDAVTPEVLAELRRLIEGTEE
jgi:BlaI family transcriptional regulator, penicillinase repressor